MKKTLVDIIPVVVGILLALLISNWQQLKSEENYIANSVSAIIEENKSNIEELDYAIERQSLFIDSLRKYDSNEYTLSDMMKITNGLYTPDLKSTTWKFLIQDSKHTLVNYELISRLSEIEKYEVLVNRYNQQVTNIIYQPAFFNDPDLKKVCFVILLDYREMEKSMKAALEEFNAFAKNEIEK